MNSVPVLGLRYIVVTPVRDEERYIAETIESVLSQSVPPTAWVIVDDGSTDRTQEIVRAQTRNVAWVAVVSTDNVQRQLGSAEVLAFNRGLATLGSLMNVDFVVKLDGDVRLPPDYFERVIGRMAADTRWGIASGVYCENRDGTWSTIKMPPYHAAGASKVIRRQCFQAIGGFVAKKGWDTVDEIRAGVQGWKTGHFADIEFQHLKPEGDAMGAIRTHHFHGEIYYQTGGGLLFLLAKVLHRMFSARPLVLGGLAMLLGYAASVATRKPRLVTVEEAGFYRGMLNSRLTTPVARLLRMLHP